MVSQRKALKNIMATQTKTASRYTPTMEQMIRDASPINQAAAEQLADLFNSLSGTDTFTAKSVAAKCSRMDDVTYVRKAPVSKTGAKIEQKEEIVTQIAGFVGANLDGLDKAPKLALQNLRDFLASLDEEAEAA
jgi:hypothetical protein